MGGVERNHDAVWEQAAPVAVGGRDLGTGDALIIVDLQNDFLSGGQLPFPHGDEIITLTDLYQLTMTQAYFAHRIEDTAMFEFFVRRSNTTFAQTRSGRGPPDKETSPTRQGARAMRKGEL
jgi:hypothetical protein